MVPLHLLKLLLISLSDVRLREPSKASRSLIKQGHDAQGPDIWSLDVSFHSSSLLSVAVLTLLVGDVEDTHNFDTGTWCKCISEVTINRNKDRSWHFASGNVLGGFLQLHELVVKVISLV